MYLSSGLSFCRTRRTSCTMGGFCHLYLLMILLMRSGDVETNPGPDRIVSEKEFLKLSKQIGPSKYKEVGINLDISIAELGQIKEDSHNTSDAFMTVFTRWRDKQPPDTDIRALLAEELERSDLGSLSGELLAGSLFLKRTGAPITMPGSQTLQPLSPDLIKRCADDFKLKYRTTLCKIRADPLIPTSIVQWDDMFTNLVLEKENRQRKRPLEYKDLFDLKVNGEFPKRIMVQGEAGAGKTTFCAKIAWDWINDSPVIPKFVWVLVVPFREAKQYTIGEIAKSYLSKDNPATTCQITEYIRSNPKDVFMAFDGFDEFDGKVVQQRKAGSKSKCHQPKSADRTKAISKSKMNKNKRQKLMQPKSSSPTSATSQPRVNSAEEYMAGVHLASLYELDHNEFNRLIEQVVLPRKKEFKHLLYFTVSRDKTIANHIMKCMVQGNTPDRTEMDFLVDVSFESQDLDTAALVRGGKSSLTFNLYMTAHTIAGYMYVFTGLVYADMVRTVKLESSMYPRSASLYHLIHLVDALCSMPNLTDLTLCGHGFQEEFYSKLNAKASTLQVQAVSLDVLTLPGPTSSQNLAESLCSMPNLTVLTIGIELYFCKFSSTLKAKASSIQGSFPRVREGNFRFNGNHQVNFDSFLRSLTEFELYLDHFLPLSSSDEGDNISDEEDNVSTEEDNVSAEEDSVLTEEDYVSAEEIIISDEEDSVSTEEDNVSYEEDNISDEEDSVSTEEDNVSDEEDYVSAEEDDVSDEEDDL